MGTLKEGVESYKGTTLTINAEHQIKQSRFDLAGSLCCVYGRHTLLSQCFSQLKCINVYYKEHTKFYAVGIAAMDCHPPRESKLKTQLHVLLNATET